MLFTITLEEMPIKTWVASPEDEYYLKNKLHPEPETKTFFNKEEVIAFLYDKDCFGWEVKSWKVSDKWGEVMQCHIELYRINFD